MATLEIPAHDLPAWMQRARRRTDWGALIAIVFSLAIAYPFLLQPGLPRTNASENYAYMTADYASALREGRFYPRWSAHTLGGYGAPIPNYYPPGAVYAAALVDVFFTGNAPDAVRIVYALALCAGGAAVYALAARRSSAAAGVLASILYAFSPYVGQVAPHVLGDLPGVIGSALLPALLWSVDRLLTSNRPPDVLYVALLTAGLLLTDPRLALAGAALAALLVIWHVATQDRRACWRLVLLGGALGVGMAACFWLPALVEQTLVRWQARGEALPLPRLAPAELFAPYRRVDLNALLPLPHFTIGVTGVGSIALGAAGCILFGWENRFQIVFLVAGAVLAAAALLVGQAWLLAPISLCFAIGGSAFWVVCEWLPGQWRRLALPILVLFVLGAALPVWAAMPRWSPDFGDTSPQAQIRYETSGYGIAVLPPDAPLPSTLPETLLPNRFLISSYEGEGVNKLPGDGIRGSARLGVLGHTSHSDTFSIQSNGPAVISLLTAFFPGWQASVGSTALAVTKDGDTGLLQVNIPTVVTGELVVSLGATPVRLLAWGVSWAALLAALVLTWRRLRAGGDDYRQPRLLDAPEARLMSLVAAAFAVVIVVTFSAPSPALHARPGYGLDGSVELRSRTEVGMEALAYRLERTTYRAGETVDVTLYWRALRFLPQNYRARVMLVAATPDTVFPATPFRHPGGYPTRRWLVGQYVRDPYRLPVTADMPPGDYLIAVEVVACNPDCAPGNRLTFFDASGGATGQALLLPAFVTIEG